MLAGAVVEFAAGFAAYPHSLTPRFLPLRALPKVWVEEAEEGFVDDKENLEEGEILVKALKAFSGGSGEWKFLCAGALVQRPPASPGSSEAKIYDAWMADAIMSGDGGPNLQTQGAVQVLDELFRCYLSHEGARGDESERCTFVVRCGRESSEYTCASYRAALSRGFIPVEQYFDLQLEQLCGGAADTDAIDDGMLLDVSVGIERFTSLAWYGRGTAQGDRALKNLSHLSSQRTPFVYECRSGNYSKQVSRLQHILPPTVASDIRRKLEALQKEKLLDYGRDSVDGVPSQHLSLVSRGDVVVEKGTIPHSILSLVTPYINDELLPKAHIVLGDNLIISDVFLRTYGDHEHSQEDEPIRNDLAGHYDVYNVATAVIALDETASVGSQGLYTVLDGAQGEGGTSHSALRRFFPLSTGDAVLHSWRVKHGHDPGYQRASLVVWFGVDEKDRDGSCSLDELPASPSWLSKATMHDEDDIGQFVLASAMESLSYYCDDNLSHEYIQQWSGQDLHPHELLIKSASTGNSDALTRLGVLCLDEELGGVGKDEIISLLDALRPAGQCGRLDCDPLEIDCENDDDDEEFEEDHDVSWRTLGRQMLFEATLRGNALAQLTLGDEALDRVMLSDESVMMASVLYALAAQQGNDAGIMALANLVENEAKGDGTIVSIRDAAFASKRTIFRSLK